ncbi:MAG: amidohydrolase [Lysobacterales bacterium]|nr:MAG: amidohydrolase [Xanthomonadales bacterium]
MPVPGSLRLPLVLAMFAGTPSAHSAESPAPPWLEDAARAVAPRVVEWRRDFHQHPELGNQEVRTAQRVAEHLRSLGLEVRTGIAVTGVVGILRGGRPGPVVALRADMDALPVTERTDVPFKSTVTTAYRGEQVGVMHACGHDGHTAILMGAAEVLARRRADLPGTVLFVFQPAEEGGPDGEIAGAPRMLAEGVFRDPKPDVVFGLHLWSSQNAGQIGYRKGALMAAVDTIRIEVQGAQTHGARPWGGVDPIVAASEIVVSLQSVVSRQTDITRHPAVVSVGAIKGGIRHNIIPDSVEMLGTVRTFDPAVRDQVLEDIRRKVEHVAAAHGATATLAVQEDGSPALVNDPALVQRTLPALERVAGAGNVVEIPYVTAAEDLAHIARVVPTFYFFVGSTPKGQDAATAPSNHSPLFYVDESSLDLGLRALVAATVDFLETRPN